MSSDNMTKSEQISEELRERILGGEWPDNSRIPSEFELCQEFKVSRTTIRAALGSLRADSLIVSRPRIGSVVALPKNGARKVCLLTGDMNSRYQVALIHHAVKLVSSHENWTFEVHESRYDIKLEEELLRKLLEDSEARILITDIRGDNTRRLATEHPDRVAILGVAPELFGKCIQVCTDIEAGAEIMMTYLLEQGHRRIAYFGMSFDVRHKVWQRRLKAAGLSPAPRYEAFTHVDDILPDKAGLSVLSSNAIRSLMDQPEPPTAIYCMSDYWGVSIMYAALAMGIKVPEELSISGFDGAFFGVDSTDGVNLCTIVQPYRRLMSTALDNLDNFKGECSRVLLEPTLVHGKTVAKCQERRECAAVREGN